MLFEKEKSERCEHDWSEGIDEFEMRHTRFGCSGEHHCDIGAEEKCRWGDVFPGGSRREWRPFRNTTICQEYPPEHCRNCESPPRDDRSRRAGPFDDHIRQCKTGRGSEYSERTDQRRGATHVGLIVRSFRQGLIAPHGEPRCSDIGIACDIDVAKRASTSP